MGGPWHTNFYVSVTNQPIMTNGDVCDNQIFFYNTTLSNGANAPRGVKGSVALSAPLLPEDTTFNDVFGIRVDTAFLEITSVPCADLHGYQKTNEELASGRHILCSREMGYLSYVALAGT